MPAGSGTPDADLLVVGAGPVGLATAIHARLAGLTTLVLDPRHPDAGIDKACGEGLMPRAVEALTRLGVDPDGVDFRGIRYRRAGAELHADALFAGAPGRGVPRLVLSRALSERAADVGVGFVHRRVDTLEQDADGVRAAGLAGRWLVAADGLHSPVRRALGLDATPQRRRRPGDADPAPVRRGAPLRYGLRRHYRVTPWTELVEVTWAADAEAYVTPVAEDCVGVAVLCRGGEPYPAWLARFPELAARLEHAEPLGSVRGCGPLRQRSLRRVSGRVLLAGDAAGYVDALTGEGLAVGLATAEAAVNAVAVERPETYERAWTSISRTPRLLTEGLLRVTQVPTLRRGLVPAARALPAVFTGVVRRLA